MDAVSSNATSSPPLRDADDGTAAFLLPLLPDPNAASQSAGIRPPHNLMLQWTSDALPTLFSIHQISDALKAITKEITVAREGKYTKVIGYKLEASTDASTFSH